MTAEECQSELIAYQEERLQYESAAKASLLRIFWKLWILRIYSGFLYE